MLGELPDQFVDYMVMKDNERNKVYVPKEPSESEIFSQEEGNAPQINVINNLSIDPSEEDEVEDYFRSPANADEEERKSGMGM